MSTPSVDADCESLSHVPLGNGMPYFKRLVRIASPRSPGAYISSTPSARGNDLIADASRSTSFL